MLKLKAAALKTPGSQSAQPVNIPGQGADASEKPPTGEEEDLFGAVALLQSLQALSRPAVSE
ncbi:MAG: hypothetical protein Alis3KO_40990 [Aliiglaciecola sp.]